MSGWKHGEAREGGIHRAIPDKPAHFAEISYLKYASR